MTSNSPSPWHVSEGNGQTSILDNEVVDDTHQGENQNKKDPESITPEENIPLGPLTDQERHLLFDKGIKFKKKGNSQHALHCLLACVRGLKDGSTFQLLPDCLHNIAEIYSNLGDYENAVSFAQAEKLYYETFLISVSNETQKGQVIDGIAVGPTDAAISEGTEAVKPVSDGVKDPQATSAEACSANEYENLAHMCLKKKDAQLALEYCGKAVKLRQSIYGEQHPVTKRTLDLFTIIYAEMGKEQYTAAMQKFNESKKGGHEEQNNESPEIPKAEGKSVTISEESRSQTTLGSSEEERNATTLVTTNIHKTVSVTPGQGMLLFFLFTALVAIGVTLFCCHITGTDSVSTYRYIVTRLKFYYYYYFRQTPGDERFF